MAENLEKQQFRLVQREHQKRYRKQKKEDAVNQNRTHYSEIEKQFKYVSEKEMEELALEFKKTKDSDCLHRIENAACFGNKHIEAFFHVNGALASLISVLCGKDAEKQLEAATCITNLACGPHKTTEKLAKTAGAYLISYIKGESRYLQDQCAWAIGNIASDCQTCFAVLNAQGVLPALESLLQSPHPEVIQSAAFALNTCTQYESTELTTLVEVSLYDSLISALKQKDAPSQTSAYILSALSNISALACSSLSFVKLSEVINIVLAGIHNEVSSGNMNVMIVTPAIRILGNLSMSPDLCRIILSNDVFALCIGPIISSQYHHLKKELLWVLTNIFVSCGQDDTSIDWQWIIEAVKPLVSPLDSLTVQVLYFYCTVLSIKPVMIELFAKNGAIQQTTTLCSSGKSEIELAAQSFLSLCSNK